jgi:hypothetical protein
MRRPQNAATTINVVSAMSKLGRSICEYTAATLAITMAIDAVYRIAVAASKQI